MKQRELFRCTIPQFRINEISTMEEVLVNGDAPQLAACVAPEDLNCGDYVAPLNIVCEIPSFMWCCDANSMRPEEPVRMQFRAPNAGTPLKIKAICLPFVFVKHPNGATETLDVRKTQLVRLSQRYAKIARVRSKKKAD